MSTDLREPVDIALSALQGELGRAERAAAAAERHKAVCDARVGRLRGAVAEIERALRPAPPAAPVRSVPVVIPPSAPPEETDNIVGLSAVPRRPRVIDADRALSSADRTRPRTLSQAVLDVLASEDREFDAMQVAVISKLPTPSVATQLAVLARARKIERCQRGRYRSLRFAAAS